MIIGIELRHVVPVQSGGVAQLLKGVLEQAFISASRHQFVVFCTVFNRHLLEVPQGSAVTVHTLPLRGFYGEVDRLCSDIGVDVLFRGYPSEDSLTFPLHRQVVQIPDLQHEHYPEFFSEPALRARYAAFSRIQGGAGALGTISEFSRQSILASPFTRCEDVFLMPPALQQAHLRSGEEELRSDELESMPQHQYFLFPANAWPHKNHRTLIAAFRMFLASVSERFELVLTGHREGWHEMERSCAGMPIRHLGFVRPRFLRHLLEKSFGLTFFSLYEGFGMPLLEAFDAGTPVLCGNTTALPEVGGDAVLACDPEDAPAIAGLMCRLAHTPELRTELVSRGRRRLGLYDWATSAANLLAACERIMNLSSGQRLLSATSPVPSPPNAMTLAKVAPLVSIVTPSRNQGTYLRRTIQSVLSQSYSHIELIVVDGQSSDDSVSILLEYGDRITWTSEPDNGQTDAINKGLRRAKGDILAYLNSDDVLLPGAVDRVVDFFLKNRQAMLVYGNAFYIDEHDRVTGEYRTEPYSRERLAQECIVCQPATFWRRSVRNLIGEFDERLDYVMDYDYWLRAAKAGAVIVHLPAHLASSRRYPETKTLSARGDIYREIFEVCWRHNQYIGVDYFIGFWHHILHEQFPRIGMPFSWVRCDYVCLGRWHYRYVNWKRGMHVRTQKALRDIYRGVRGGLRRVRGGGSSELESAEPTRVRGFSSDNWVGSRLRIDWPRRYPSTAGYLAGISPTNQIMEIVVNGVVVDTRALAAQVRDVITVPDRDQVVTSLELRFPSNHNSGLRQHAFRVEGTNLFLEHDIDG